MKRARGLLQFNEYHKYTVDVHCLRAVEAATNFEERTGPIGDRYRRLDDKLMLHLSLLIHDLGKGFEEDHSDVVNASQPKLRNDWGLMKPRHRPCSGCYTNTSSCTMPLFGTI